MPRPTSLSIELLRTLVSLVNNGGDAMATAKELGINQPSMSKRLRVFQHPSRLMKRPWVERHGHVWKLTEVGERAYPGVEEVIRRYRQLLDEPEAPSAGPVLSFACGPTSVTLHVLAALIEFRKTHPQVRVRIRTPRSKLRIEGLVAGGIDLAELTHDEKAARRVARRPLVLWKFTSDPLCIVTHQKVSHEWAKAIQSLPPDEPIRPKVLVACGAPLLLPESGTAMRELFDRAFSTAGLLDRIEVVLETGGWTTLADYAREGFGVALMTRATTQLLESGYVARTLDESVFPAPRTWLAARRRSGSRTEADLTPEGAAFRDVLLEQAQRNEVVRVG